MAWGSPVRPQVKRAARRSRPQPPRASWSAASGMPAQRLTEGSARHEASFSRPGGGHVLQFAYDNWNNAFAVPQGRFASDGYVPFVGGPNPNSPDARRPRDRPPADGGRRRAELVAEHRSHRRGRRHARRVLERRSQRRGRQGSRRLGQRIRRGRLVERRLCAARGQRHRSPGDRPPGSAGLRHPGPGHRVGHPDRHVHDPRRRSAAAIGPHGTDGAAARCARDRRPPTAPTAPKAPTA